MIFKRFSQIKKQDFTAESTRQKLLRFLLVSFLFSMVLWGVWENGGKQKNLFSQTSEFVFDETELLPPAMIRQLKSYTLRFKNTYGVSCYIRIHKEALPRGREKSLAGSGAVVLELCPATKEVLFIAPPLVLAALGPELSAVMEGALFMPWFDANEWPKGLEQALNVMTQQLDAALVHVAPKDL